MEHLLDMIIDYSNNDVDKLEGIKDMIDILIENIKECDNNAQ